ncbi:ATP-binding Cassette (ABC) Superfamily [Phytophthora cinnamomi]|uniref:ATP-binding Cassette (ABC) Superfamily n=1 Tax=Phytophthora cinnamomi TaxID=4785 RepID=UPI00355A72C3|nr:ATP-binding Cassette (ABC) Superfamily [Phytophthora cinnamomi]
MGNRFSRKKTKQQASAAGAAASQKEAVVAVLTSAPLVSELSDSGAPKDEKVEVVLPLSARQAPPTARDGSEGSPVDFFRRCYELEEDPFTLYTQALLLKDQREFAAASELLRSLLSNASLTIEARSHLAQCLIAQDPALSWCREEAAQCLEDVIAATSSASNNADSFHSIMYRESLELLAHVMIADKRFARALQLLDALQAELNSDASVSAALRQQQTLVSFQRAFCRYALGDSPDAVSAELLRVLPQKLEPTKEAQAQQPEQQQQQQQEEDEAPEPRDPLEGIELLLHADAASLRQGLAPLQLDPKTM